MLGHNLLFTIFLSIPVTFIILYTVSLFFPKTEPCGPITFEFREMLHQDDPFYCQVHDNKLVIDVNDLYSTRSNPDHRFLIDAQISCLQKCKEYKYK